MKLSVLHLIAFMLFGTSLEAEPIAGNNDLSINSHEKRSFDAFKTSVAQILDYDYKKEDIYLLKWIRSSNYNLAVAAQKLNTDIKWRKELNMEKIHDEDWTDLRYQYDYDVEAVDKAGQPVLVINMGHWDIRSALVSGEKQKLERLIYKMLDETSVKVRKLQHENSTVTRAIAIIDVKGFSATQQGCLPCLPLYVTIASSLDLHFPELLNQVILVNVPAIFQLMLGVIKPALPNDLRMSLKEFGNAKDKWQSYLKKIINEDQLFSELGGTRLAKFLD